MVSLTNFQQSWWQVFCYVQNSDITRDIKTAEEGDKELNLNVIVDEGKYKCQ